MTYYEALIEIDGQTYLLGYSARVGRVGLLNLATTDRNRPVLLERMRDENAEVDVRGGGTKCTIHLGGNMLLRFGRTERFAKQEGEHPTLA